MLIKLKWPQEYGEEGIHGPLWERGMKDMRESKDIRGKKGGKGMELKVKQILSCFGLHGLMVMRLVTLEFGYYALVWLTQILEDIGRGVKEPT
ncbi:hypothetical protein CR513_11183, partial [Mucuna pruriens]